MSLEWSALPWDTEFFGTPIGSVDLAGADLESLARVEREAREAGIRCLYGRMDPVDAELSFGVQTMGWHFVEAAITLELRVDEPPIPQPADTTFRLGTPDDTHAVAPIVERMAPWSRFAVDPHFGADAARRMHAAWLARAVDPDVADHSIVVAEADGEVTAFIGRSHRDWRVDAVGTTRPSSGAARYLIETAREWAGEQTLLGGPIAARNINSLRYVSHCGYRTHRVEYLFHRWLDEPGGGGG
jgi:dTDP-4-amino-4,6-dideoxy-D-galactose acyltransferase